MTSPPLHHDAQSNLKGIVWALLGVGVFSFYFLAGKFSDGAASATQIMWMRYTGGFITVVVVMLVMRTPVATLETRQLHFHAFRAAMGSGGGIAAIYAAAHMPVANATAIGLMDAVFVMLFGVFLLKETVTARQWLAAGVCLAGAVVVIVFGRGLNLSEGSLFTSGVALAGALFLAIESLIMKRLARSESAMAYLFYVNLFGSLILTVPGLIEWRPIPLTYIAAFLMLGPLAIAGQSCNIMAFRLTDIALLAPVKYTWIVFAALFGFVFFGEVPTAATYAGGALIVAGGAALALSRVARATA
ncbi:EamA-like transporter family protein [Variibacter gotjawalensis]|uniref:EamA-like transporter family protein n=1 Tax=Variibacter gotjawalensis TaxID=1333996 RepID=A0A0S3PRR4_9BRAD|nr:DMT family transporter [Variibacter gotjawalensis]NIK48951.1 drug/metabolite transporter (DMT)-like permease [Variibacter gotjawalensis]RZS50807.1 EamA domain-containing membrane protein RarD [Variibacter gotjawalensis]BAT58641.1 EamA-like transporter family protein [Variibacter gotjawalensis]